MDKIKNFFSKIITFLSEVKVEMGKVAWPSQNEIKSSTIVVIISVFIFSIFVWIFDLLIAILIARMIVMAELVQDP